MSGLVVLVMIASSTFSAPLTTNAKAQGTTALRVGFLANIESLNPFRGINDADYFFYGLVYDYLFALDQDGHPQPDIALSAVQDTAGYNWTYTIRQGVKWHDQTPLTVDDVAFSINYNIPSGGTFFHLWAYEPYVNRVVRCATGQTTNCGAVVTGPWQVTVYFDLPFVPGTAFYIPIIQKAQWSGVSQQSAQTSYANLNPIGTGPYMADANIGSEWTNSQPLLLHKNPNYHVYSPKIDDIYLVSGFSDVTLVQALQKNPPEIDLAELTPGGYAALANSPGVGRQEYLLSTQYWTEIGFEQRNSNTANKNLNPARWDQNVRQALAKATDKDFIVSTIYQGKGWRGSSLMSYITPFWHYDPANPSIEPDPTVNLTFNVQAANAMLDSAGYSCKDSDGIRKACAQIPVDANGVAGVVPAGRRLEFSMGVRQEYKDTEGLVADYLVTAWGKVGVKLGYTLMLESALSDAVYYKNTLDTYIWYWSGDPDPNYLLSIESGYTLDGWNDNYWNNATYNNLYVQSLAARDENQRQQIVRAAEKVHYQSAVYIIMIYPYGEWAYRTDRFTGWGDWGAHPYRQLNAFWTAPPLFADLQPVGAPTVTLAGASARPGQSVTITGTIQDTTSGTWTLDFGDGSAAATGPYTSGTYTVTQTHTYSAAGTYTVRLTANNGAWEIAQSGTVTVTAVGNLRPDRVTIVAKPTSGLPGTRVNFTVSGHDAEGGDLVFSIAYDDGASDSQTVQNVGPDLVTFVNFTHLYTKEGSFFASATISDGQATSDAGRVNVVIQTPVIAPSGLDTRVIGGGIVIAVAVIAAVAIWARRRARKKEEGPGLPPPPPK